MKSLINKLIFWLPIILPVIWIYKNILFGQLPVWGDAPFFYPEALRELFREPSVWVTRGVSLGGINSLLWISPVMFLAGVLNKLFLLENTSTMRIVFYFPSIIFSLVGVNLLTKYLNVPKTARFFAVLFYLINTYLILLIDGGQIGVSLAYGIFPLVIFLGKKMLDKTNVSSFFVFLLSLLILSIVDPRISIIAYAMLIVWQLFENWKRVIFLLLSALALIPLNFYWIWPLMSMETEGFGLEVNNLQFTSLLNSLLVYAPHWPGNIFGKIIQPPFYFILIPFLIFGSIIVKKEKRTLVFILLFLFFSFLSKGTTPPLGGLYNYIINFQFGVAFRDSSKFFIPLILFGGILIGQTADALKRKVKIFPALIYLYLIFLVNPSFTEKLNFILGERKIESGFETVYKNINSDSASFKTLWFPETHPLAFDVSNKSAVNAKDLIKLKPIARINASNDIFNFLNNPEYIDWLRVLGFKYLLLPGDTRNINPTQEEAKDWQIISSLIDKQGLAFGTEIPKLNKLDWGLNFPVYEIGNYYPEYYSVNSLIAVVGPMLDSTTPAIYFEDGKLDPNILEEKNEDSLKIYFNEKGSEDLTMSFLQKYFVSASDNVFSQWAGYGENQYLNAKYELLIRDFKYQDLDYGKGISFSTNKGEVIKFKFEVPKDGKYILAIRLATFEKQNLSWMFEKKELTKGRFEYLYENKSGFEVLNIVSLIPDEDYQVAKSQADIFIKHFGTIAENEIIDQKPKELKPIPEGTLKYKLDDSPTGYWIVFNQSYHPQWNIKKGAEYFGSVPIYSMVNGFYIEPDWGDLHIEFLGQKYFRWGLWVSTLSFLILSIVFLFLIEKNNERKNPKNTGD